ncbi:MAG: hypothetical protein ACP5DZ_10700, partial [Bacteroidales bacterium]
YETITNSDGKYSIELPTATHQGVQVEIQAVSFEAQQTQADNSYRDRVYKHTGSTAILQDGEIVYQDINYVY